MIDIMNFPSIVRIQISREVKLNQLSSTIVKGTEIQRLMILEHKTQEEIKSDLSKQYENKVKEINERYDREVEKEATRLVEVIFKGYFNPLDKTKGVI